MIFHFLVFHAAPCHIEPLIITELVNLIQLQKLKGVRQLKTIKQFLSNCTDMNVLRDSVLLRRKNVDLSAFLDILSRWIALSYVFAIWATLGCLWMSWVDLNVSHQFTSVSIHVDL